MIHNQQIQQERCELRSTGEGESACDIACVCIQPPPDLRGLELLEDAQRCAVSCHLDRQRLD